MVGVRGGVDFEQLGEDGANASAVFCGKWKRVDLFAEAVVVVIGYDEGGLRVGGDGGSLGGRGIVALDHFLVSAITHVPEQGSHSQRGENEDDERMV